MIGSFGAYLYLFLLAAAASGGGPDPLETAIRRFDEGYRTWDLARMRESASLLAPLCGTDSGDYETNYWLGAVRFHILLHRLGDTANPPDRTEKLRLVDEAVSPLEEAVRLKRDDSEARALLATLLGMRIASDPASALWRGRDVMEHRRLALENGPENPRAHYLAGSAYYHMPALLGRKDKGLEFFLKAKDLFEKERGTARPYREPSWGYASCLTFIGRIHAGMGKTDDARAEFQRALELNPKDKLANECLSKLNGAGPDNAKR
ncbi:MAG: tetratricopeptide repeat protein [FCB group bacterium]|jgi:tetratricopeptide (TPR) repeat protein|nr:tetratricopeptide repeat protein [FCB group bacterium]